MLTTDTNLWRDEPMYIAMTRFRVKRGREYDFEQSWRLREAYLQQQPGFAQFTLLRNWLGDNTVEYISHTTWRTREDFDAWRESSSFQEAHARAALSALLDGHPEVSLYETVMQKPDVDVWGVVHPAWLATSSREV
jgi:heme-degrading monooxygenase HmoA